MRARDRKPILIDYLKLKISEADWHAVADCAMDLRELEIEIRIEECKDPSSSLYCAVCSEAGAFVNCHVRALSNAKLKKEESSFGSRQGTSGDVELDRMIKQMQFEDECG